MLTQLLQKWNKLIPLTNRGKKEKILLGLQVLELEGKQMISLVEEYIFGSRVKPDDWDNDHDDSQQRNAEHAH
jgi:hypothetical protein